MEGSGSDSVEEIVRLVLTEVVYQVVYQLGVVSDQDLDRASIALGGVSLTLSELLNSLLLGEEIEGLDAEVVTQLKQLHLCLTDQILEWETRLQRASFDDRSVGRSKKPINIPMVEMMRELGYTWEQISSALMVSRTTLWRRLRDLGIQATAYTSISDSELDSVMSGLVGRFPQNGVVMMWGHLRSLNICITRARVYDSLMQVSSDLAQVRRHTAIRRRVYSVPAPNCLWHIDGLHCLIRWRIVVHGAIDGFSRRIVYLRASDNNRADTVMNLFRLAVHDCGWPSRVRSDKGGENIEVARAMLAVRGTGRRSHLAGSSVHNQRIERLWRDTFRCVCHFFYSMFYEMEDLGILDPVNDADLFSLHYVFIPRINVQLSQFMNAWNHHPLRTEHGFSPLRLWHQGMLAADPRWQQDIIDGFNIPSDYGVESSMHFTNTFEQQRVEIPRIDLQLSTEQVLELQTSFSPFQASDYGGADIYVDVRQHIFNNLHL